MHYEILNGFHISSKGWNAKLCLTEQLWELCLRTEPPRELMHLLLPRSWSRLGMRRQLWATKPWSWIGTQEILDNYSRCLSAEKSHTHTLDSFLPSKFHVCYVQSCPTLCKPMDCNPPGSSVHEIFRARILEWVAISYSRGSSWPIDQNCLLHWQAYSLPLKHWVSPKLHIQFSSVQFSCSVVSDSLWPWGPKLYTKLEFPVFWGNVAF